MVQVLKVGYQVPFISRPPLPPVPLPLPSYSPTSVMRLALSAAVSDLQAKNAIEPASSELGFYSRLFVTPKVTGGWRPVIDLSRLSHFVRLSYFCIETSLLVHQSLHPGDWMVSIDLQDAYLQVPVHPESRWFLTFCVGHQTYQFRVLCFGLSAAPQVFTRVMAPISSMMHRFGYRILRYLDDWLVLWSSFQEIARVRDFLLWLCQELGVFVNPSKNSLDSTQTLNNLGMTLQTSPLRAFLTLLRIRKVLSLVEEFSSSRRPPLARLAFSSGGHVIHVCSHSRCRTPYAVTTAPSQCCGSSALRGRAGVLGRLLPPGSSVVARCRSSRGRGSPRSSSTGSSPLHRRVRLGLGCVSHRRPTFRLVDFGGIEIFHQTLRALGSSLGDSRFSPSVGESVGCSVLRQYHRSVLAAQGGWYPLLQPQCGGPSHSSAVQSARCSSAPPIYSGPPQRPRGFPQSELASPGLRMDSLPGGLQGSVPSVAGHHRPLCDLPQPSASSLFLSDGGSASGGNRRSVSELGSSSSIHVPPFCSNSMLSVQGSSLPRPGGDFGSFVLASQSLVSGTSEAAGGGSDPSAHAEESTQTTLFPSLQSEPPRASVDWLSYCKRSAQHLGFSSRVARQLAFCCCSSMCVNHQAKWLTYRGWCRRHGHSIFRPSVSKIADFLLYLRRSLHLSYSSIASYRSMLSKVFRFVLPSISSHPVLHDLLQSFCIERPLPSLRVPSWDLSRVLTLLRCPPFEPLVSCSIRDLSRKVLFLVSLATARRVGELHEVSSAASFSGDDIFLSYLPEFRAKSESASNPLPRSFRVCSLRDFVGDLPDELLLCPVRALSLFRPYFLSFSSPRSLFVSPRAPSCPLSKNALSFFLRSVILQSLSPDTSLPSSSSASRSSSVRAHSIRGMATSAAFSHNASLSSILEAATWHSSSVFTSFYLRDIQFSSAHGYSLGLVVAAGNVL